MKFYLPTFEECMEIVKKNDAFLHRIEEVDGLKFHIFNYRLANWEDFQKYPAALEMRGLTFLEYYDGTDASSPKTFDRYIALHKFFNLNQGGVEEEKKYKDQKISRVQYKEDGSMIQPVVVGHNVYCKTKGTFSSEMAQHANKIIEENKELKKWILNLDFAGFTPYFEYVGPWNKIVLDYEETGLILIQIRSKYTGEYVNPLCGINGEYLGIKIANELPETHNLEHWVEDCKTGVDYEGYVITFENSHVVKVKTDWYGHLHHLLTENLTRENELIKLVLNEELDDVLVNVPPHDVRRHYALDIAVFIRHQMVKWVDEIEGVLCTLREGKKNSRKDFALANQKHQFFGVMMRCFTQHEMGETPNSEDIFEMVKEYILKNTDKWGKAQGFLKSLGFSSEHKPPSMEE